MIMIFFHTLAHYAVAVLPALAVGFLLSGIFHEFIPQTVVQGYLGKKGIRSLICVIFFGALLPMCCCGTLPMAVSFKRRGVPLGLILAFLIATPATSIAAILVMWKLLGLGFTLYMCAAVILMGLVAGLIGNCLPERSLNKTELEPCPECGEAEPNHQCRLKKSLLEKTISVLRFSFVELPKEIGLEIIIGLIVAALVTSITPVGQLIEHYLAGLWGYAFAVVFGLVTYICSTASVPFVDAFIGEGLSAGAGVTLLLVGPITSYGTILVLRKEFGMKILFIYLSIVTICSLAFGYGYSLIR